MIGVEDMGSVQKAELREVLKKERSSLSATQREHWDEEILSKFWQLPEYVAGEKIMVYLSFGDEINTWPILDKAWQDGKRIFVPKVRKYPNEMIVIEIESKADLKPSLWGIYEPIIEEPVDPRILDLVVVPGLAFDAQGYRLGYGGGYYDRFLPQTLGYKVGFCYQQFLQDIPIFPWDQPVDLVITPGIA